MAAGEQGDWRTTKRTKYSPVELIFIQRHFYQQPAASAYALRRPVPPRGRVPKAAANLFLFALPNQNADHSASERIRMTELGRFYEPLVAVQTIVMQLVGARPSFFQS